MYSQRSLKMLGNKNLIINKENIQPLANLKKTKKDTQRVFGKEIQNVSSRSYLNTSSNCAHFLGAYPEKMQLEDVEEQNNAKSNTPYNPQLVTEFHDEIIKHIKAQESHYRIDAAYMSRQRDINGKMRAILIDWLVDVNLKFKLLPQTLFITVNIVDRYLSVRNVSRQQLQLLGVTALMLVSKYEEIYPPLAKDYVAVCDNAYTKEELLEMESKILQAVSFNLTQTSTFTFLEHLQVRVKLEERALVFARYILESSILDLGSLQYSNHELAAGAIFLVNKIFRKEGWRVGFEAKVGVTEHLAKACAKDLFAIMQKTDQSNLTAVKRKFATAEFFEVSKYRIEKIQSSH